jgi:rfaE bifunctional protein kinase chain/domain
MLSRDRVEAILDRLPNLSIGLVGDLFLDRYLWIDPQLEERSVETGMEAWQVTRIVNRPGAQGTVINNLSSLGVGRIVPVTIVGDDGQAHDLLAELNRLGVDVSKVLLDPERLTPTYTKPMKRSADGAWRELNRIDFRNRKPLSPIMEHVVIDQITRVFHGTDGLIVSDQVNEESWGVVTPRVRDHLAGLAASRPDRWVLVDSRTRIGKFRSAILKPNLSECCAALGRPKISSSEFAARRSEIDEAVRALSAQTHCRVACTQSEHGMLVAEPNGPVVHVPGPGVSGAIDPVGAGDSASAGMGCALLCGCSLSEAAWLGNVAASITVRQIGTTGTASPQQVLAAVEALGSD